ncbi:MAG: hypothetical protein FWD05_08610 [Oscillospiraceae bacterium]|nr:hypothetical protein [Oscillospiraceae bacterium]
MKNIKKRVVSLLIVALLLIAGSSTAMAGWRTPNTNVCETNLVSISPTNDLPVQHPRFVGFVPMNDLPVQHPR